MDGLVAEARSVEDLIYIAEGVQYANSGDPAQAQGSYPRFVCVPERQRQLASQRTPRPVRLQASDVEVKVLREASFHARETVSKPQAWSSYALIGNTRCIRRSDL